MTINNAIDMFLKYCKGINLAKLTVNDYRYELNRFMNYLNSVDIDSNADISVISIKTLKSYFLDLQSRYAISSVRKTHAVLSSLYRFLVEDVECIEVNLLNSVRLKFKHESKKQSVVKNNEMSTILDLFENVPKRRRNLYYYRNKLIVQLLYGCGPRVGELVLLRFSDFNEADCSFSIIAKGDKDHKIFIGNDDALATYKKIIELNRLNNEWVFPNKSGGHLSTCTVRHIISNLVSDAGIEKNITPHSFRRGCATSLVEDGVDVAIVKDVLGHADISTTMRYVHLSEKTVRDTMSAHCPLNNLRGEVS